MLLSLDDLKQYAIHATDGEVGRVKDFYFDDLGWTIRYLVVDTGSWLMGRQVLISPMAVGKPNWNYKTLPVDITQEMVKNSPDINTDKPVSRQNEQELLGYYGYPNYWGADGLWGMELATGMTGSVNNIDSRYAAIKPADRGYIDARVNEGDQHKKDDSHLRSCKEVTGYQIHASDGEIGHISGMLVDAHMWAVRYLIVDTSNWWVGHKVLIAPLWLDQVRWPTREVTVNLTREQVKNATAYDASVKLDRTQEDALHRHYGRIGYWDNEISNEKVESYD